MQIQATGQGHSVFYLNNRGAQESAKRNAQTAFDRKAKTAIAAVPCPDCHHLQKPMVRLLKNQRWLISLGLLIALAIPIFFEFWPSPSFDIYVLLIAGIVVLGDAFWLITINGAIQSLYPFAVLAVDAIWGFHGGYYMFYLLPVGVILLLGDAYLALTYDPLKTAWRPGRRSKVPPVVVKRETMEAAQQQTQQPAPMYQPPTPAPALPTPSATPNMSDRLQPYAREIVTRLSAKEPRDKVAWDIAFKAGVTPDDVNAYIMELAKIAAQQRQQKPS
jgi:hypothetical protein